MRSFSLPIVLAALVFCIVGTGCRKKDKDENKTPVNPYDFTWSEEPVDALPVTFTSNAPSGSQLKWIIDKDTTFVTTPKHTFGEKGTYKVSLIVNGDLDHQVTKYITVGRTVWFVHASVGVVGDDISFMSDAADSAKLVWDFGDGTTSTETKPFHRYEKTGKYNIKLRVNNHYDALGNAAITIIDDPMYTYKIKGNRLWNFNVKEDWISTTGSDTSYTQSLSINIGQVDKTTISMYPYGVAGYYSPMNMIYNASLSNGNKLVFSDGMAKLIFDHVSDTLYFSDERSYGKGPYYTRYVTGSAK